MDDHKKHSKTERQTFSAEEVAALANSDLETVNKLDKITIEHGNAEYWQAQEKQPGERFNAREARAFAASYAEDRLERVLGWLLTEKDRPALAWWLYQCLDKIAKGEDGQKVFGLTNSEGPPLGIHGPGRYTTTQVAALWFLARRKFKTPGCAATAVAQALNQDLLTPPRIVREDRDENGKSLDLSHLDDEHLRVLAGPELLRRVDWTK